MKSDNTKIVASHKLANGKSIGLSDTNSQNEGFEEFKTRFEAVKAQKPQTLQEFITLLANS